MSQMHIIDLARWHSPEFLALEMPFIFESHDHAKRVLEGEIGRKMLDCLKDKSPAKGMEFTYSGGFRCIVSETPIEGLDGLKGVNFATTYNPVTLDTCEAIGAVPKIFSMRDLYIDPDFFKQEGVGADALETTIPRFLAQFKDTSKRYLINTKHNLFLTSIIIGNEFWATLSEEQQALANTEADKVIFKWIGEYEAKNQKLHSQMGIAGLS
jgi:TRAP-type C4-dicarboxylate transport system substrate-binding protein